MDAELTDLAYAAILGLGQLVVTATLFTLAVGLPYAASPRDTPPPRDLPLLGARLKRATANFIETFPLAAAAILAAHVANRHNLLVAWGAPLYLWSRVAHLVLYLAGIPYLRTLAWFASLGGIVLVLAGLFGE